MQTFCTRRHHNRHTALDTNSKALRLLGEGWDLAFQRKSRCRRSRNELEPEAHAFRAEIIGRASLPTLPSPHCMSAVLDFSGVTALFDGRYLPHPSRMSSAAKTGVEPDLDHLSKQDHSHLVRG